jgi:hypothetical protein
MKAKVLVWGLKVSKEFREKVDKISSFLGIDANWLMAAIAFETAETFSPSVKNAAGSGATGLIQNMPRTAKHLLGTKTPEEAIEKLEKMTAEKQLDYVKKYFEPYKNKIKNLEDLYMAILWPSAVGKPLSYVLFSKFDNTGNKAYVQNKGLDLNGDGYITKAEAAEKVRQKYEKGLKYLYVDQSYLDEIAEAAVIKGPEIVNDEIAEAVFVTLDQPGHE